MVIPTHVNNLFNLKINNISSNGTLNMGNAIQKGHSSNAQSVGGQTIIGDLSPSGLLDVNAVADPDGIDQPQIQV